jgi:multiple sugar transport system ATP-binding protein
MAQLQLEDVTKRYQDRSGTITAVRDLDLEVKDGEFVVIVGPSGCGKSTTLRMIAGLETATGGSIRLDDSDVTGVKPQNRDIAMVFQSYALYPHMSVRENMAFGLEESTDLDDDTIAGMVEDIAELLDIPELLDRKPDELSGGQQQRVALGRAIVRDPEVFLMDEPLSNLDAKLRASMRTELQRLHDDLGTTTIYVTHDQTEAMTMADRIAILDGGELQQIGTPLECYYQPANRFVAGFIGEPSMNFHYCTREGDRLDCGGFDYRLSEDVVADLGSVTDVTLGIRPEHVEVEPEGTSENDIQARVDVTEPFGKEQNFYLFPVEGDLDEAIIGIVESTERIEEGETVRMRLPEEKLYFFDSGTGEALRHPRIEGEDMETVVQ